MAAFHRIAGSPLLRSAIANSKRTFHGSAIVSIKAGDAFPDVELMEGRRVSAALPARPPGTKLSLARVLQKQPKAIVVGVPAAFSPACSATHVPGYIAAKSGIPTYVVSVNDAFVMKAWKESLLKDGTPEFRFLADPAGALTAALDMEFDSEKIFGNKRSKRYALYVQNGKVKQVFVEPDNTGVSESAAGKVLEAISKA
ncbi:AhpC/TSA family protein [Sphaerosporella brunnea]|uniref:AhpC/TSA family protein n=1 Tax=Sphaerosporella brunnea TaxID=1250544 RepID=A0A5J5F8M7_9PEZI|nr:AhpC/TSA family protein [Sphaerosporella brunnea]